MDLTDITARFEPAIDAESEAALRRQKLAVQVAAVRRRSRFIQLMRKLFPGAIAALFLVNAGWIVVTSVINSFNVYGGNSDEIRMTNPRFVGQSGKNGRYVITGLEAIRKGKDSQIFTLKSPTMEFQGEADGSTHMSSSSGVYDINARQFDMTGDVNVTNGKDFTFKTEEAMVDMANSTIHGDKHIDGTGAGVHIEGESFVISDNGRNIVFSGRGDTQVHSTLQGNPPAPPPPPPPPATQGPKGTKTQ